MGLVSRQIEIECSRCGGFEIENKGDNKTGLGAVGARCKKCLYIGFSSAISQSLHYRKVLREIEDYFRYSEGTSRQADQIFLFIRIKRALACRPEDDWDAINEGGEKIVTRAMERLLKEVEGQPEEPVTRAVTREELAKSLDEAWELFKLDFTKPDP